MNTDNTNNLELLCICGARLKQNDDVLCHHCLKETQEGHEEYYDQMDGDHASGLASAGWGTDEDYGYFGGDYE